LALWIGQLISSLGDQIFIIAFPILIFNITQSTTKMGLMGAIEQLPVVILGLFIGVIVDSMNRKKIIMIIVLLQLIVSFFLTSLIIMEYYSLLMLFSIGFLLSTFNQIYWTTQRAILPAIIKKDDYKRANAQFTFINTITSVSGPTIAGILIATIGVGFTMLFNNLTFIVLFVALLFMDIPPNTTKKIEGLGGVFKSIKEGFQCLISSKIIMYGTIFTLVLNIGYGAIVILLIPYLKNNLNLSTSSIGFVFSMGAAGGIFISVVFSIFKMKYKTSTLLIIGALLNGIGITTLIFTDSWLFTGISYFVAIAGATFFNIIFMTLIQEKTPSEMLGRLFTTTKMIARIATPISMLLSGIIAEIIGVSSVIFICGISICIIGVLFIPIFKQIKE